ncbi:TadA family conjugal transfer-associated ATPase [Dermabacteraceae bacterium TAE3-ERU27]|nr:TadA family conjugal transfer-associated ATPase [Dermabacteraceae bacterium TAE3-ERU27]
MDTERGSCCAVAGWVYLRRRLPRTAAFRSVRIFAITGARWCRSWTFPAGEPGPTPPVALCWRSLGACTVVFRTVAAERAAVAEVLPALRLDLVASPGQIDVPRVRRVSRQAGMVLGAQGLMRLTVLLREAVFGLGDLEPLLAPGVSDINVNPDGSVWVDDGEGLRRTDIRLSAVAARELAVRLATSAGRRLDDELPYVDAHLPARLALPAGARLHATLPPLSEAPTISLRLPSGTAFTLRDLERAGTLSALSTGLCRAIIASGVSFLISGGTGSGKTTLLTALLGLVPARERLVLIEDARELQPDHPHVVSLQARHANAEGSGEIGLEVLVRQALRMRPDRIVVGECRGREVRELLQALNTGHDGGAATVHANSCGDVPARLEALGALSGLDRAALAAQAAAALRLVLHMRRDGSGRRYLAEAAVLRRDTDGYLAVSSALTPEGVGPAWGELRGLLGKHGALLPAALAPAGRGEE